MFVHWEERVTMGQLPERPSRRAWGCRKGFERRCVWRWEDEIFSAIIEELDDNSAASLTHCAQVAAVVTGASFEKVCGVVERYFLNDRTNWWEESDQIEAERDAE